MNTAALYRPAHGGHPTPARPWKVHVYIKGLRRASYFHCTEGQAREHARTSGEAFGVLGCSYRVEGPATPENPLQARPVRL